MCQTIDGVRLLSARESRIIQSTIKFTVYFPSVFAFCAHAASSHHQQTANERTSSRRKTKMKKMSFYCNFPLALLFSFSPFLLKLMFAYAPELYYSLPHSIPSRRNFQLNLVAVIKEHTSRKSKRVGIHTRTSYASEKSVFLTSVCVRIESKQRRDKKQRRVHTLSGRSVDFYWVRNKWKHRKAKKAKAQIHRATLWASKCHQNYCPNSVISTFNIYIAIPLYSRSRVNWNIYARSNSECECLFVAICLWPCSS